MIYIDYTNLEEFNADINADFNNDFSIGDTLDIPKTYNTEE